MNLTDKPSLVGVKEEDQISRNVLIWIHKFPDYPDSIDSIGYESLKPKEPSMALSTIPGSFKIEEDITGGYEAEYQFKVIYRLNPGKSPDARLSADEALNALGDWATGDAVKLLDLGEGRKVVSVEAISRAALFAPYEDGYEDHQIIMRLTYEVMA